MTGSGVFFTISNMTSSARIRVLIVDDQPHVRKGLQALLDTDNSIEVVGVAFNGIEAVQLARSQYPNVILMDASMPHLDGSEAARLIKTSLPGTRIILMQNDGETISEIDAPVFVARIHKGEPDIDLLAQINKLFPENEHGL